jgi:hypothetical protein
VDEDFNVRELTVAAPDQAKTIWRLKWKTGFPQENKRLVTYSLPPAHILKPGAYDVYISVGRPARNPSIALPLPDDDGHRRCRLGAIEVVAATGP